MDPSLQQSKTKLYHLLLIPIAISATWLLIETALLIEEFRQTFTKVSPELVTSSQHAKSVMEKLDNFVNVERLLYVDQASRNQIKSADEATKGATRLTIATVNTLEQHIQPAIDELHTQGKETLSSLRQEIDELKRLTKTTNEQVQQNGDQVKFLLEQGNTILAESEPELLATLSKIKESAEAVEVLTNDPALAETLKNIKDTSYHVSLISKDVQQLAHKTIDPVINPKQPKNNLDKYLIRPTIKIIKFLNGAGNVLFLVQGLNAH